MHLSEAVIELHYIAKLIEDKIGVGNLSEDLRRNADSLNELIKPLREKNNVQENV